MRDAVVAGQPSPAGRATPSRSNVAQHRGHDQVVGAGRHLARALAGDRRPGCRRRRPRAVTSSSRSSASPNASNPGPRLALVAGTAHGDRPRCPHSRRSSVRRSHRLAPIRRCTSASVPVGTPRSLRSDRGAVRCTIRRNAAIFAGRVHAPGRRSVRGGLGSGSVGRTRGAPRGAQGPPQGVLDLRVHAAQIVGGPPGDRVVDVGIQAQQHLLALRHAAISSVERAGVHDGLGGPIAAEHDQQVGDHLRLALLVEVDDVLLAELVQRVAAPCRPHPRRS